LAVRTKQEQRLVRIPDSADIQGSSQLGVLEMLELKWYSLTVADNKPISLHDAGLSEVRGKGVYVIYRPGTLGLALGMMPAPPVTIRVGSGEIGARLCAHRLDKKIVGHQFPNAALYAAWAEVSANVIYNVERYLADVLRPLVGDAFPDVEALPVTLPFRV
jgi:hypothetical protein